MYSKPRYTVKSVLLLRLMVFLKRLIFVMWNAIATFLTKRILGKFFFLNEGG